MKILYLTQWFEPEPAFKGATFARALAAEGHEVEIATGFPNYPGGRLYPGYHLRPISREIVDGMTVFRLPLYPSHDRSASRRISNYLSFFVSVLTFSVVALRRYDVIYVYHPPITPALAVALPAMLLRVPFILDVQDLWPDSVAASGMTNPRIVSIIDRLCRFVYRRAAHLVCQSDGIVKRLVSRGVERDKMTRIYNWSTYQRSDGEAVSVPADIEQAFAGHVNVVYGGNVGQAQGLECLIAATVLAQKQVPALRLHIIGDGIARDVIAAAAAATDAVRLYDPVPRTIMDRVFDRADILILHLRDDPLFDITIPSKLQHYLSAGKPIIAGIGGEAAALLAESGAALVSQPGDVAGIGRQLVAMTRLSPADRKAMGAAGRNYYDRCMGFDAAIRTTLSLIAAHGRKTRS